MYLYSKQEAVNLVFTFVFLIKHKVIYNFVILSINGVNIANYLLKIDYILNKYYQVSNRKNKQTYKYVCLH